MTIIHNPGGNGFRIERIWAFLAVHGDGDEGVIALNGLPCIAADEVRLMQLRPKVEDLVREHAAHPLWTPIVLARFETRVDCGIVE